MLDSEASNLDTKAAASRIESVNRENDIHFFLSWNFAHYLKGNR